MKLGLERNDPSIATLSAVGSVYEAGFPAKHGYLHQGSTLYSGWVSVPNPDNKSMNIVLSRFFLF